MSAAVTRGLAEQELTQFADCVQSRILQSAPMSEAGRTKRATTQKRLYSYFVESNSCFYEEFMQVSGLSVLSVLSCETIQSWFRHHAMYRASQHL